MLSLLRISVACLQFDKHSGYAFAHIGNKTEINEPLGVVASKKRRRKAPRIKELMRLLQVIGYCRAADSCGLLDVLLWSRVSSPAACEISPFSRILDEHGVQVEGQGEYSSEKGSVLDKAI